MGGRKTNLAYEAGVLGYRILDAFGINPLKTLRALRGVVPYWKDASAFSKSDNPEGFLFSKGTPFPCLGDRFEQSGTGKGAYFHQDLLVAQKIFRRNPERHIDVGSSVSGFVAHVASYREIEVLDVRPLEVSVKNIRFRQCDLMAPLKEEFVECTDSLSCLHALEHFGMGRYGDPVRADGFQLGWNNLHRMLTPGGTLYFSVPMGRARIEFNAHRVFSVPLLLSLVDGKYELVSFSYIDDAGNLHENVQSTLDTETEAFGCHFGCAVLELKKK